MVKTDSETLFENYCTAKGISWQKIQETVTRTPDYDLTINGQTIVVEVKEIIRNEEEQESDRLRDERGYGNVLSTTPGDRVRRKIGNSSAQIKARTLGTHPSILVLFDGYGRGHLDPYQIRVAMYGLEQVYIGLPPLGQGSPHVTGMGYGAKRKMTEEHNTSISAVGVLFFAGCDDVRFHVYHNKYAAVPLALSLLATYGITQFVLDDAEPGTTAQWVEVTPGT
jgi:hypothetical protein